MFPSAPIFQQYNYFRQNLKEYVTFTFFFLILPQISLVKYHETIEILMQLFVYFRSHFHYELGIFQKQKNKKKAHLPGQN